MLENPWGTWMPASMSDLSLWSESLGLQSACSSSFHACRFVKCFSFKQSHQVSCHATIPPFHLLVCFWVCCLCHALEVLTTVVILLSDGPWNWSKSNLVQAQFGLTQEKQHMQKDFCASSRGMPTNGFLAFQRPTCFPHSSKHLTVASVSPHANPPELWI